MLTNVVVRLTDGINQPHNQAQARAMDSYKTEAMVRGQWQWRL